MQITILNKMAESNKSLPPDFLQQEEVQENQAPIKLHTLQFSKTRMVQGGHSVLNNTGQKIAYIGDP